MSDTLHFEIVSPDRLLKDSSAAMVVVPGAEGDFAVLPAHAPMMSTIRPGVIEIYETEASEPEIFFLKGGLAQVGPEGLTILAEETLVIDEVDIDTFEKDHAAAIESYSKAADGFERDLLEKQLAWMTVLSGLLAA
jgi:F-type H+-transporting ATPase subunit epsilon